MCSLWKLGYNAVGKQNIPKRSIKSKFCKIGTVAESIIIKKIERGV